MQRIDGIALQNMSLNELKALKRDHFASMSADDLECLLARMGVALSLRERNNKQYYLTKLMEFISELIETKSRHAEDPFVPTFAFPHAPLFPHFQPSPTTPVNTYPRLFHSPNTFDPSPSAPPLLMMPPFTSPERESFAAGTFFSP